MRKWKILDQYREQGFFSFVDLFFAERVLKTLSSDKQEHAALLAVLFALSRQGHLTLDLSSLDAALGVGTDPLKQLIREGIATFPEQGIVKVENNEDHPNVWICQMGTRLYLQKNWIYETEIVKHLERLAKQSPTLPLTSSLFDSQLNAAQKKAIENAVMNSLSLLTGGPGTGKTYTAGQIVKTCLNALPEMRIILTAPTGKAVSQLEGNLRNVLNPKASVHSGTLHAVLGIKPHLYEDEEISTLFADLIIVDESSMIDAKIFSRLLASIPHGARVVLIGDKDQLPPVEAGSIFADLLEAGIFPSSSLTECLRSDRSEILGLAQHIKQGDSEAAFQFLEHCTDVSWVDILKKPPTQVCAHLWERYRDRFAAHYALPEQILNDLGRFALLSSMRQGPLGVDAINRHFLQQSMKQVARGSWWVAPIMITRNDYELELYNGDLGFLVRKFTGGFSSREFALDDYCLLRDRKIAALNLPSFEYSYCLSVHKSQGSEYNESVILIPPGSESFGREILYTAVTRARTKVTLMCDKDLFVHAVKTSSRKMSGLCTRLKQFP